MSFLILHAAVGTLPADRAALTLRGVWLLTQCWRTLLWFTDDVPVQTGASFTLIERVSKDLSVGDVATVVLAVGTLCTTHTVDLARMGALYCRTRSGLTGNSKVLHKNETMKLAKSVSLSNFLSL